MTFPIFRPVRRLAVLAGTSSFLVLLAGPLQAQKDNGIPAKADAKTIIHVLNRIGFGPRPGDVERVQEMGLATYIDQQLHPERIADEAMNARLSDFTTLTMSTKDLSEKYYQPALELRKDQQLKQQRAEAKAKQDPTMTDPNNPNSAAPKRDEVPLEVRMIQQQQQSVMNELMQAKVLRAAMSDKQLDEVLVDFWFNHFNVYAQKGAGADYLLTEYERDVIRPHVLGKFRDLLGAIAQSPAMLFYLDNWQSAIRTRPHLDTRPDARCAARVGRRAQRCRAGAATQRRAAPRAQRELRARADGAAHARRRRRLHAAGRHRGRARVHRLDDRQPRRAAGSVFPPRDARRAARRSSSATSIPAGGGEEDGEQVLDILARASGDGALHRDQARAPLRARRTAAGAGRSRRDDVPRDRRRHPRGAARRSSRRRSSSSAEAYRAKVKTPFEFVVSAVRATGATVADAQPLVAGVRSSGCRSTSASRRPATR